MEMPRAYRNHRVFEGWTRREDLETIARARGFCEFINIDNEGKAAQERWFFRGPRGRRDVIIQQRDGRYLIAAPPPFIRALVRSLQHISRQKRRHIMNHHDRLIPEATRDIFQAFRYFDSLCGSGIAGRAAQNATTEHARIVERLTEVGKRAASTTITAQINALVQGGIQGLRAADSVVPSHDNLIVRAFDRIGVDFVEIRKAYGDEWKLGGVTRMAVVMMKTGDAACAVVLCARAYENWLKRGGPDETSAYKYAVSDYIEEVAKEIKRVGPYCGEGQDDEDDGVPGRHRDLAPGGRGRTSSDGKKHKGKEDDYYDQKKREEEEQKRKREDEEQEQDPSDPYDPYNPYQPGRGPGF